MNTNQYQQSWHSTKHIAGVLNISERHVRRLIATGVIKAIRLGRVLRVSDESIEALVESHSVQPTQSAGEA